MHTVTPEKSELKKTIRDETLKKRDAIPLPVRRIKDSAIRQRLLGIEEFRNAKGALLYASFRSEVDTAGIIEEAISMGKRVMLPKVSGDELKVYEIKSIEELFPGYMGIPEPRDSRPGGLEDVELVIVPGTAFDTAGWRLGYGKGYYDKMLAEVPKERERVVRPLVALAYEEQIVQSIPHEAHDIRMDYIITDKRVIKVEHGQREN